MSGSHPLPPNPLSHPSRSEARDPSPPSRGFSRSGFAPIPYRHSELPPAPREREREFPRRELDPEPEIERWERRMDREDYERRAPASHWEDDYDRPKRRRSPSPLPPSQRPRMRSPSPPRYPPPPSHNLPDPASVDTLLPFRQFAEWFRASHPQTAKADEEDLRRVREQLENGSAPDGIGRDRVGMGKRYERYRKEYTSRQLFALYLTHKASPWFQERYSSQPAFIAQRRRVNRQGRVATAEKYLDALRAGKHDGVVFDLTEANEKQRTESAEPEGLDRALGDGDHATDEPLRIEVPPRERQVFVKTVPPSASRKELEALFSQADGFQYIALTEPATKKSFHRVAWAQFADGVDVEAIVRQLDGQRIENFTFHMGVNATPVVGKIRVTQPIANTLERLRNDGEKAKALVVKLEEELLGDDEIEGKPEAEDSERKLPGLGEKGSTLVEETIARVLGSQGMEGEELDEEQRIRKAKITLDQWISYLRHGLSTCYYCVAPMSYPEELHRKCIAHMRPHPSAKSEMDPIPEGDGEMLEEKRDEERADADMREAEDGGKAEIKEKQASKKGLFPPKSSDLKWEEVLDGRIKPLLGEVNVLEYGGRDVEEESKKVCAPLIKQEEASKYRCKECNKLFKAPEFVIKHIAVKHPEVINPKLEEVATLNNFVLDPQHIQPTATTPAAVNDRIISPVQPSLPAHQQNFPLGPTMFNPSFNGANGNGNANGQQGMNVVQQQMMMMMQMQQAMLMGMNGNGASGMGAQGRGLAERVGGFVEPLPLPPVPVGGEDPRAKRGRVSYRDLDEPGGGGDGGLPY